MSHKATKELFDAAVNLYRQGYSYRDIAKEIGVAKSAIHRWITIFAEESHIMKKDDDSPKARRAIGKQAPIDAPTKDYMETDSEKIARLEKELKEAKMRADLYNEIINVAEQKFNIQIRKKAGTKQ